MGTNTHRLFIGSPCHSLSLHCGTTIILLRRKDNLQMASVFFVCSAVWLSCTKSIARLCLKNVRSSHVLSWKAELTQKSKSMPPLCKKRKKQGFCPAKFWNLETDDIAKFGSSLRKERWNRVTWHHAVTIPDNTAQTEISEHGWTEGTRAE